MVRTRGRRLEWDLTAAIEDLGMEGLVKKLGVKEVIEAVGFKRIVKHFGIKRIMEEIDLAKIIEERGVDWLLAKLSPARLKELKERLQ